MKVCIFILSFIFLAPSVFACTQPSTAKISAIVHNQQTPTYWRTVQGSSFNGSRNFPALVTVQRQINRSLVEYKGDVYYFDQQGIEICDKVRPNEIQVVHPRAKVTVVRTGNGDNALLTVRAGFITVKLRPAHLVSVSKDSPDFIGLDLFQMIFNPEY